MFLQLFQLAVMAGGARAGNNFGQGDYQRGVRVGVAFQAIGQAEMGGPLMAVSAERDDVFVARGVALMAVRAGKLVAMCCAVTIN